MADTIAAAGSTPTTVAQLAKVFSDAQVQDAEKLIAAIASSVDTDELAALAKMLSSDGPVVIKTAQLQAFLKTVLADSSDPQLAKLVAALASETNDPATQQAPNAPVRNAVVAAEQAIVQEVLVEQVAPEQLMAQAPATKVPNQTLPGQTPVPTPPIPGQAGGPQVNTAPVPTSAALPSIAVPPTANSEAGALLGHVLEESLPNANIVQTAPNTNPNSAAASNIPNAVAQQPNTNAAPAQVSDGLNLYSARSAGNVVANDGRLITPQSTPQNVAQNANSNAPTVSAQWNAVRAAYNSQTANDVLRPNVAQLLTAEVPTVFGSQLAGRSVPVSVTVVDPQRLVGDHTGGNTKAFLLGAEKEAFSVVMVDEPVLAQPTRVLASTVEQVLNASMARALPEEVLSRARVVPLDNGMFAIVYQGAGKDAAALRAAPLLNNVGFSLFAEPVRGGEQLLTRLGSFDDRIVTGGKSAESHGHVGEGDDEGGRRTSGALNGQPSAWTSAINGWYNAVSPFRANQKSQSILSLGLIALTAFLVAIDTAHWGEYLFCGAIAAAIAFVFAMYEHRESQPPSRIPRPWRLLRPIARYIRAARKRTGEPWVYFVHEQDWIEWSKAARMAAEMQDAKRRALGFILPDERNAFANLGLAPTASWKDVNAAFRILAKQYHPDVADYADEYEKAQLTEEFHHIMSAYIVLRQRFRNQ